MNMRDIELFRGVMLHGGISRAAAALGVAQPNISRAVASLEREVGFDLFAREKQRLSPTAEGEAFYREVEFSFAGLDRLGRCAADIREFGTGRLRVACLVALSLDLAPRALQRFMKSFPNATISFQARPSSQVWEYTAGGQCDIGFAGPKDGFRGVTAQPFLSADGVAVLPRGHRLARKPQLTPADFAGEPFLSLALEDPTRHMIDSVFANAGVQRRLVVETQPAAMLCAMAAEGLGISIVTPIVVIDQKHRNLVVRPISFSIPFPVHLLRPTEKPLSRLASAFIAKMEQERDAALVKFRREGVKS